MKKCERCGAELLEDDIFCSKCGATAISNQGAVCTFCGANLHEGGEFCWKCGRATGFLDDEKTLPLDDGATVSLDDEATVSLDNETTVPIAKQNFGGNYEYIPLDDCDEVTQAMPEVLPEESQKKKSSKIVPIIAGAIALCAGVVILAATVIIPSSKYNAALELAENGSYDEAVAAFTELGDYKDSAAKIDEVNKMKTAAKYDEAVDLYFKKYYPEAAKIFTELGDYEESQTLLLDCNYNEALALIESGNFTEAKTALEKAADHPNYKEAEDAYYTEYTEYLFNEGNFGAAKVHFESRSGYDETDPTYLAICVGCAEGLIEEGKFTEAVALLENPEKSDTEGAKEARQEAMYAYASANKDKNDKTTKEYLNTLTKEKYMDSQKLKTEIFGEETSSTGNQGEPITGNLNSSKPVSLTLTAGLGDNRHILKLFILYPEGKKCSFISEIVYRVNGDEEKREELKYINVTKSGSQMNWSYSKGTATNAMVASLWIDYMYRDRAYNSIEIKIYDKSGKLILKEYFTKINAGYEKTVYY